MQNRGQGPKSPCRKTPWSRVGLAIDCAKCAVVSAQRRYGTAPLPHPRDQMVTASRPRALDRGIRGRESTLPYGANGTTFRSICGPYDRAAGLRASACAYRAAHGHTHRFRRTAGSSSGRPQGHRMGPSRPHSGHGGRNRVDGRPASRILAWAPVGTDLLAVLLSLYGWHARPRLAAVSAAGAASGLLGAITFNMARPQHASGPTSRRPQGAAPWVLSFSSGHSYC